MQAKKDRGQFVISLDFELLWGVWDLTTIEKYGANIIGVQKVIPRLLSLFAEYDIKATFATVGFLFAKDKAELLSFNPELMPTYNNPSYNVYEKELPHAGNDEKDDPYHFAYSLFEMLKNSPHEIGTHTYSHYYCLEDGQTALQFNTDLTAAKKIAAKNGVKINSLVFPRNQINEEYLDILTANNIMVYRGNPTSWIYKPRSFKAEIPFIRICRLMDTYFPISGYNTHTIKKEKTYPVNIPASRFLKPYVRSLRLFEKLRMHRIKREMLKAAQKNQLYHLWWHPHNFGTHLEENISFLSNLLQYYVELKKQYGFNNLTMEEAALSALNSN